MLQSLWTDSVSMRNNQLRVDTTAHNLANINTYGYIPIKLTFHELLYTHASPVKPKGGADARPGNGQFPATTASSVGTGEWGYQYTNYAPSAPQATGMTTDIMVDGDGYLQFSDGKGGILLARGGNLRWDEHHQGLVNQDGFQLLTTGSEPVPAAGSGAEPQLEEMLPRIELVQVAYDEDLIRDDNGYFLLAEGADVRRGRGGEQGLGSIIQGFRPAGDVDMAEEMTNLIKAHRAYQLAARSLSGADNMLALAVNMRR